MNVVSYVSGTINDLEARFDSMEESARDTLGDRIGTIAFQIYQVIPFIYIGAELSGITNQTHIDTAIKIFFVLKFMKNRTSKPLITPQADRLICNLIAARYLYPYVMENNFSAYLTSSYTAQCLSTYYNSVSCFKDFTVKQYQQYFDILNSGEFSAIKQCALVYDAVIKNTPHNIEEITPYCQKYFDTINSIILSSNERCSSLFTAFANNTFCIGAAALKQCQENFYTLNLNTMVHAGAAIAIQCQERVHTIVLAAYLENFSKAGIFSWIGQKIFR